MVLCGLLTSVMAAAPGPGAGAAVHLFWCFDEVHKYLESGPCGGSCDAGAGAAAPGAEHHPVEPGPGLGAAGGAGGFLDGVGVFRHGSQGWTGTFARAHRALSS